METHLHSPFGPGTEAITHRSRPDSSRGSILGNLFKEVIVRVKEK
jgi:hypothetical protein